MATLQQACKLETDLKLTYYRLMEDMINEAIQGQVRTQVSRQLRYQTDLDQYKYLIKKEHIENNIQNLKDKMNREADTAPQQQQEMNCHILDAQQDKLAAITRPKIRVLEENNEDQFKTETKTFLPNMLGYLWEDPKIFTIFANDFLPAEMLKLRHAPDQVEELLEMVVNQAFIEHTSQVQDWRVVELTQHIVHKQVAEAKSI